MSRLVGPRAARIVPAPPVCAPRRAWLHRAPTSPDNGAHDEPQVPAADRWRRARRGDRLRQVEEQDPGPARGALIMRAPKQLAFWVAVGGVAILADVLLNIAADRFPQVTGLQTLNNYRTRRNG